MERALLVAACLFRSLAHQYRNDLAVLQNELTYLKSLTPEGECDRAFGVLKDLGNQLKLSEVISTGKLSCEEVPVSELIGKLHALDLVSSENLQRGSEFSVDCDLTPLCSALRALLELTRTISSTPIDGKLGSYAVSSDKENLLLSINSKVRRMPEWLVGTETELDSFSALIIQAIKIDSVWAALSDAIIWAHGGESKITLRSSGELAFSIALPLKK